VLLSVSPAVHDRHLPSTVRPECGDAVKLARKCEGGSTGVMGKGTPGDWGQGPGNPQKGTEGDWVLGVRSVPRMRKEFWCLLIFSSTLCEEP
jgi:hypothetical protein